MGIDTVCFMRFTIQHIFAPKTLTGWCSNDGARGYFSAEVGVGSQATQRLAFSLILGFETWRKHRQVRWKTGFNAEIWGGVSNPKFGATWKHSPSENIPFFPQAVPLALFRVRAMVRVAQCDFTFAFSLENHQHGNYKKHVTVDGWTCSIDDQSLEIPWIPRCCWCSYMTPDWNTNVRVMRLKDSQCRHVDEIGQLSRIWPLKSPRKVLHLFQGQGRLPENSVVLDPRNPTCWNTFCATKMAIPRYPKSSKW